MVNLTELSKTKLKQLLGNINQNPQMVELYESKWHRIIHFLHNSVGYVIAKVAKAGSIEKQTQIEGSDLDVKFCTSPNHNLTTVLNTIRVKAEENFGQVANVIKSKSAVKIYFKDPKCNIDVVYLTLNQFDKEHEEDKNIGRLPQVKQDAIKLAKYAFYKSTGDLVKGYEIEKVCINSNCNSLVGCVNASIYYFTGRLIQNKNSIDDVLRYLT